MNTVSIDPLSSVPPAEGVERPQRTTQDKPVLIVQWHRVLFLHFEIEPTILQAHLPGPFELELYQDKAVVSLVALTKRCFRPAKAGPLWTRLLSPLTEQRLFNLRAYVRHQGEPGAFFFWSWLSRPWGLPLPDRPLGLTCAFAKSRYEHQHEAGNLRGVVEKGRAGRFAYTARVDPHPVFTPCPPGSLAEFALEHDTAYFWHRDVGRVFHAWHSSWTQIGVELQIIDNSLVLGTFPWLREAHFLGAHYAPGFEQVTISGPVPLDSPTGGKRGHHHGTRAFFEMP